MTFNLLDLVSDSKLATKKENKKKLHKLLDKYGSVEEIERSGDLRDSFELDFARIDGALEEVLEERQLGYREPKSYNNDRLKSNTKQSNSLLPDDEDFSLEGLTLSDRQRKTIDKLDMNTQLTVIRALREQQGVEKTKSKKENSEASRSELDILREKVEKANREIKIADNEHERTKSDAKYSKEQEDDELEVDYSKYGKGFSREFIDTMLNDKAFQMALKRTSLNEGGYVNNKNDRGGETNMGITKKYYPDEDIKHMTRERANAILYRDYWIKYKINTLPNEISDIVFDNAVVQGQGTAIKNLQKALNIKADGIIGTQTLIALKGVNYQKIKKIFSDNANAVEDTYQRRDSTQKEFEKGHRKRYNSYYK